MSLRLSDDIRALVAKYGDTHEPCDILKKVSTLCELELSNITLHKRLDDDVFELFDKEDEEAMKVKHRLSGLVRVVSYHTASTCSQFVIESEIEFAEWNLSISDVGSLSAELPLNEAKNGKKRSKSSSAVGAVTMPVDSVRLYYQYNEQSVGSADRPPGVSVLESPCKTINLTVSMARGAAGLDKCVVVDFEMLTAKHSPSENQIPLNHNNSDEGSENDGSVGSDEEQEEGESDSDAEEEEDQEADSNSDNNSNDDQRSGDVDMSDYYSVRVDREALEQVSVQYTLICDSVMLINVFTSCATGCPLVRSSNSQTRNSEANRSSSRKRRRIMTMTKTIMKGTRLVRMC